MEGPNLWAEVETCERYLVSCMYEEAASSATSVLQKVQASSNLESRYGSCDSSSEITEEMCTDADALIEAAAMVLVQAYRHTGRTTDIFNHLKQAFGSVALIPYSVLVVGVCMQLYDEKYDLVRKVLEEFLAEWEFSEDNVCYILSEKEAEKVFWHRSHGNFYLSKENYLQLVELYAFNVLVKGLRDQSLALKWLENAKISDDCKEDIGSKIRRFLASELSDSSAIPTSPNKQNLPRRNESILEIVEDTSSNSSHNACETGQNRKDVEVSICRGNSVVSKLKRVLESLSSWYPAFAPRVRDFCLTHHGQTALVWIFALLVFYLLRRKWVSLKRNLKMRSTAVYGILRDFWNLAFNVQLNPLAAVQPLPSVSHVGRVN